jgi:P27 family predicted phage terminase small subunit
MAKPGPARRPNLQVVREGNPGKRSKQDLEGGLRLTPEAPGEPDWRAWFPVTNGTHADANGRMRGWARDEWRRVVPVLDSQGILASVDRTVLVDYCLMWSQLQETVRDLSTQGIWQWGERGAMKNPSSTVANQLRTQLKFYVGQLGLSPVARDAMNAAGGPDGDSPFD